MTKYEGSAAVINAIELLRTVWNEMVRQFPDVPEERRVDLYSTIMPSFLDITSTVLVDDEAQQWEGKEEVMLTAHKRRCMHAGTHLLQSAASLCHSELRPIRSLHLRCGDSERESRGRTIARERSERAFEPGCMQRIKHPEGNHRTVTA